MLNPLKTFLESLNLRLQISDFLRLRLPQSEGCLLKLVHIAFHPRDVFLVHKRHLDLEHTNLLLQFVKLIAMPLKLLLKSRLIALSFKQLSLLLELLLDLCLKVVEVSVDHRNHTDLRLHPFHGLAEVIDRLVEFLAVHFVPNSGF